MHFQIETPPCALPADDGIPVGTPLPETVDLLRQLLEVQREQLLYLRASAAAHDNSARWRAFLGRWQDEFPELSQGCKETMPVLERTFGRVLADLTEGLRENGPDALDNDFNLQEFLDRYGMRLAQMGTLLNLVGPLADAATSGDWIM